MSRVNAERDVLVGKNKPNKQTKTAALKAKGYRKSLNLATNHQDGNTT